MKKTNTQYITDDKGKKKAVILDIKEYQKILRALDEKRPFCPSYASRLSPMRRLNHV